jgi:hypothetical protein
MHLARADGLLWLGVVGLGLLGSAWQARRISLRLGRDILLLVAGYLLVMGPWMARNLLTFGSLLSPGGLRAVWFTSYNDLYRFPGDSLTLSAWLSQGARELLAQRLWAAGQNLQSLVAVQGLVFLLPLILLGMRRAWHEVAVRLFAFAWLLTFLVMSLVFPFPGARGGYFHSSAALQPILWALSPLGLQSLVEWGSRVRKWDIRLAWHVLGGGLVVLAAIFSLYVYSQRVIGIDPGQPAWNQASQRASRLAWDLASLGVLPSESIMINDPPTYYLASGGAAIAIPFGSLQMVQAAAQRYTACTLVLEQDQVVGSSSLFNQPGDAPGVHLLGVVDGAVIYRLELPGCPP